MARSSIGLAGAGLSVAEVLRSRFGTGAARARVVLANLLAGLVFIASSPAAAAPLIQGEVSATTRGGYARIVFKFVEENEAEVRVANGIAIIAFKKPVDVFVDRLAGAAPAYIAAARRDPDGGAVRLALARKVTINTMIAGERIFVDLLPETWSGVAPGLPQEVVEELARRAREAEQKARREQRAALYRNRPPVRVRVGVQPTFTRYVFELPEIIPVATERENDLLTLVFDAPVQFDLADVTATLPATVSRVTAEPGDDRMSLRFALVGKVDIRTFREDNSFVVDISAAQTAGGDDLPSVIPGALPRLVANGSPAKPTVSLDSAPLHGAMGTRPDAKATMPAQASRQTPEPRATPRGGPEAKATPPVPKQTRTGSPASAQPAPPTEGESQAQAPASDPTVPVVVEMRRKGAALEIVFPFTRPTPAAIFRRFDVLWLVFDSGTPIDVAPLIGESSGTIRSADVQRSGEGQIVRLRLERPRLASAGIEGPIWTLVLGDMVVDPVAPLNIVRTIVGAGNAGTLIAFDEPHRLHRLVDPEVGDALLAVTALGPARGFLKGQDLVEFQVLPSVHGVAIQPLADDLQAELSSDKIVVGRPHGLTLSALPAAGPAISPPQRYRPLLFDRQTWDADRQAPFRPREIELMRAAAMAPAQMRTRARLDLARFYIGRAFYPEAKAVIDAAVAEERPTAEDPSGLVLRAIANIMMRRGDDALRDLAETVVGDHADAALWRALAHAVQGRWIEARRGFKATEDAVAALPAQLQCIVLKETMRVAIEVRDFADAARARDDLQVIDPPRDLRPAIAVLSGRLAEGLGRLSDALSFYRSAATSGYRPAEVEGRLRELVLRYTLNELDRSKAMAELETLTATWRGDETEIEALQLLARLYTEEERYRDAFQIMRTALATLPDSTLTRRIQDETAATFDSLFVSGKAEALPAIEALSLFYDFRQLMPIGRRGDEMIRRLADRLVSVDLLDQAAELLQHQVEHRLQGAARAQVAARLAVVHLMNRKPDRALRVLRATRSGDLNNDLRSQRLLIEARALSDLGRHDLALEVLSNLEGRVAERLRVDTLWAAKRWREAAEQTEKFYGDRWRDQTPLSEVERGDLLRAAIGFALGADGLGLARFREKYAAMMGHGPHARVFAAVSAPLALAGPDVRALAKEVVAVDTLDQFLREMRTRYPESSALAPAGAAMRRNPPSRDHGASSALTPPNPARTAAR